MISRNKQREYLKALQELERQATGGLRDELAGLIEALISAVDEDERSPFREQIIELINTRLELVNPEIKQLTVDAFNSLTSEIKAQEIGGIEGYTTPPEATESAVRSAAGELFDKKPRRGECVRRMQDFVSREIRRTAAENMMEAVEVSNSRYKDQGLRFARVPQGKETCMLCLALASRGFAYRSRESALSLNHYHTHCDCLILPGYDGVTKYEGYDHKKLQDRFKTVEGSLEHVATHDNYRVYVDKKKAAGVDEKDILDFNGWKFRQTLKEMRRRDTDWINGGETPPVGFKGITRAEVKKQELETAEKLRNFGIRCIFHKDYKDIPNPNGKGTIRIGLPDCKKGIELKAINTKQNTERLTKHIQRAKSKRGCKAVFVDNIEMSKDAEAESVEKLLRYLSKREDVSLRTYLLDYEGKLIRLK